MKSSCCLAGGRRGYFVIALVSALWLGGGTRELYAQVPYCPDPDDVRTIQTSGTLPNIYNAGSYVVIDVPMQPCDQFSASISFGESYEYGTRSAFVKALVNHDPPTAGGPMSLGVNVNNSYTNTLPTSSDPSGYPYNGTRDSPGVITSLVLYSTNSDGDATYSVEITLTPRNYTSASEHAYNAGGLKQEWANLSVRDNDTIHATLPPMTTNANAQYYQLSSLAASGTISASGSFRNESDSGSAYFGIYLYDAQNASYLGQLYGAYANANTTVPISNATYTNTSSSTPKDVLVVLHDQQYQAVYASTFTIDYDEYSLNCTTCNPLYDDDNPSVEPWTGSRSIFIPVALDPIPWTV